jgi:hypothetical protein
VSGDKPSFIELAERERNRRINERVFIDRLSQAPAPRELSPDQTLIWNMFEQAKVMAIKKSFDYGSSIWESPILAPEMSSQSSIEVRLSDKIRRIIQLKAVGATVKEETLKDTFIDLGVYAFMWVIAQQRKGGIANALTAGEGSADRGGDEEPDKEGQEK